MPIPLSARLDGSGVSGGPPWPVGGGGPPGSVDPPIQWLVTSDPFSLKSITCAAKKTDSPPDEGRVKWARVASLPSPVISTTTFGVSITAKLWRWLMLRRCQPCGQADEVGG